MTLADSSLASLNRLEEDEIEALKRLKSAKSPVAKDRARTHLAWVRGQISLVKRDLAAGRD